MMPHQHVPDAHMLMYPRPLPPQKKQKFTLGRGTSHLPAFSLRFCLIVLDSTLARSTCYQKERIQGSDSLNTSYLGTTATLTRQ